MSARTNGGQVVLIPAYRPGGALLDLVVELQARRPAIEVLVVDDGSGPAYQQEFTDCVRAGARVLSRQRNRGKGAALRAGFAELAAWRFDGAVVTADADGQHAVDDILAALDAVDPGPGAAAHLVLGERGLDVDVPLRSRVGNTVTRWAFRAVTGQQVHDTQTGLRAFPATMLPWLARVPGDRYEYELQMLLHATRDRVELRHVAISTIYLHDNESSHFRPVADSARIYAPLLMFLGASLTGFVIDTVVLLLAHALFGLLLPAVVLARLVSGSANFALNRRFVFGPRSAGDAPRAAGGGGEAREPQEESVWVGRPAVRYAALAAGLLAANYVVLSLLFATGIGLLAAKVLTEIALLLTSFVVQARFVFRRRPTPLADRSKDARFPAPSGQWMHA